MKSIREAIDHMLPYFVPRPAVDVSLRAARDHVLARDLLARHDLPELDNSAMDGYAVRFADLTAPGVRLTLQGESRAGSPPPAAALAEGHALRIFTGAPLPALADSVVMQEDTTADDTSVVVRELPRRLGMHVRARGSDLRAGNLAIPAGSVLGAGELGLAAAQGYASLSVIRRPRVAILCTGDELRELDEPARPGSIVNSNAYTLAAAVESSGCEAWVLPTAKDELGELRERITQGLSADLLLTIGGVSVGDYDLVEQALGLCGVSAEFHKVAIKPGKPLLFGIAAHGVPVIGLPGNPVSALVTFEVFVRPGLRRMQGHSALFAEPLCVMLAADYQHSLGRTELARASLSRAGKQPPFRYLAKLHQLQGSGSLPSLVGVDALVVCPGDVASFIAGSELTAIRLGAGPASQISAFHLAEPPGL